PLPTRRSSDLVRVHVGRGARAGLEDVERDLVVPPPLGHFLRGLLDQPRLFLAEQPKFGVGTSGRELDQAEGTDERAGETQPADREVLDGTGGGGAIERVGGYPHLAHAVALNPVALLFGHSHPCLLRGPLAVST